MWRLLNRRKILIGIATAGVLLTLSALLAFSLVRWGYVDQWLVARLQTALAEYGVRLELGSLKSDLFNLEIEARELKFYPENSSAAFATLEQMRARITLHDLLGWGRPRQIQLRALTIVGLRLWYRVDEQGRSNLASLHLPPEAKEKKIIFTYKTAQIELRKAEIYYLDRLHQLEGTARHLTLVLSPESGDLMRARASAQQSDFLFDGRQSSGISFELNARVNEEGALVDALHITSPLLAADLQGELRDWRKFNYQLKVAASVKLQEVARLFAQQAKLEGAVSFNGQVAGEGVDYSVKGEIRSDKLLAQGVRIEGLQLGLAGGGKKADYEARTELALRNLAVAGFQVNRWSLIGGIAGNGEELSWLANFQLQELLSDDFKATGISLNQARLKVPLRDPARFHLAGQARISRLVTADVPIGHVAGEVSANRHELRVINLSGELFEGQVKGSARFSLDGRGTSEAVLQLRGLNLDQAVAVAVGKRLPLRGVAEGSVKLTWLSNDYATAEGMAHLKFTGSTLRSGDETISDSVALPDEEGVAVNGEVNLVASERQLRIENTLVQAGATRLAASGTLWWDRTGTLEVSLDTADAAELQSWLLTFAQALRTETALKMVNLVHEHEVQLTGALNFRGLVTGSLDEPQVKGHLALDALHLYDESLGQFSADLSYANQTFRLERGWLRQHKGGRAELTANHPFERANSATLRLRLEKFELAPVVRLLGTFPFEGLLSGEAEITGLPEARRGTAHYQITNARYGEIALEEASGRVVLDGRRIELNALRLRSGKGVMTGKLSLDTETKGYSVNLRGEGLDVGQFINAAREGAPLPFGGTASLQLAMESAEVKLEEEQGRIFDRLEIAIASSDLSYRGERLGQVRLNLTGRDSIARLELAAELLGHSYRGAGEINFSKPEAPVKAEVVLKDVALAPLLELIAGQQFEATGRANGQLLLAGNLFGTRNGLQLETNLTQLDLEVSDYHFAAHPPVRIRIGADQLDLGTIRLSGKETNLVLAGSVALGEKGRTNFSANGDVNLRILQSFVPGLFADGLVRVQVSGSGTYERPRFSGALSLQGGVLRSAEFPLAISNARGRLLFTADQARIESFTADIGTGRMNLIGGAAFSGLRPSRWRFQIKASEVRMDYPRDARTTFDGDLTLQGNQQLQVLSGLINVRRAEYLADVDLFEFIERVSTEFGTPQLSAPGESRLIPPTQLDVRVVANETLLLRTKSLDVVASAALQLRGPSDDPSLSGRISISRGIIDNLFKERYRLSKGFIEFSGSAQAAPRLSIEAETEIAGYRLIVLVSGSADQLRVTPRSEPPLPQSDVIALITTGQLSEGLRTDKPLEQTSVGTIASLVAQPLSSQIESRVTGRLFGLNRFSIDPLLVGRGADPTARITIGRRVTKDLSITYSTNLAANQDQVILIEYRASDRISLVASRAQNGTFGLDLRLRKRF